MYAVPYIPLLDPVAAAEELQVVPDAGAVAVNVRNAPVPVPGGHRPPFEPTYDAFCGPAAEAGVVAAPHAGLDGYDSLVPMWEPGPAEQSLFRPPPPRLVTTGRPAGAFS